MSRARRSRYSRGRLARLVAAVAILAIPVGFGLQSAGAAVSGPQARAVATPPSRTTCKTAGGATTCTGTYGGDRAYNPKTGTMLAASPTVTVSPTTGLVNQVVHVSWTNFTPTYLLATHLPNPRFGDLYHVAIYECRGTNPQSPVGDGISLSSKDCYDLQNTSQSNTTAGAANGVITYTLQDGTGEADVLLEAGPVNTFLNCSNRSPCSLAVVPNWGGQQPTSGAGVNCANHSHDYVTVAINPYASDTYIGAPCSWADRIVVPLSFSKTPSDCPAGAPAFQSDGSPMLEAAMAQWQIGLCGGRSGLSLGYNSESDYLARQFFLSGTGALSAGVDMALVTQPATAPDSQGASPSARRFTYAPLANSGIAIAYYFDSPKTGKPATNLVLNARLVAKLLTESYSLFYDCTQPPPFGQPKPPNPSSTCDPAVAHNPNTIFDDPEFLALNGGDTLSNRLNFPLDTFGASLWGTFLPIVVSGTSDMTHELTRWVESDPAARAFLQGQAETWTTNWTGKPITMAVNKNYRGFAYPVDSFTPLDQGWSTGESKAPGNITGTMQESWNPVVDIDTVATDLATFGPTSHTPIGMCLQANNCPIGTPDSGYGNPKVPGQPIGQRVLMGVVSQNQAVADAFPTARLVNAAGQPVAPGSGSISAAVSQMTTNPDKITQQANYSGRNPNAYPLAMVDYAMVPTCHLAASAASAMSTFLAATASTGQRPGTGPGQLSPGYAPLDSHQHAQLLAAAKAVKAQSPCSSSGGHHGSPGGGSPAGGSPAGGSPAGNSPSGTSPSGTSPAGTSPSGKSPSHGTHPGTTSKPGSKTPSARTAGYGVKDPNSAGFGRFVLPILLIVGGILGLGGPGAYLVSVTGGWPALQRRLGKLPHRLGGFLLGPTPRRR
jgi:hypothetical protein